MEARLDDLVPYERQRLVNMKESQTEQYLEKCLKALKFLVYNFPHLKMHYCWIYSGLHAIKCDIGIEIFPSDTYGTEAFVSDISGQSILYNDAKD